MSNILPPTPQVPMQRIIMHWTAGGHEANATDRRAYHVLVEGDGNVILGIPSIAANSGTIKPGYAAHTLNCNSGSIGVSLCCMAGAQESPFNAGRAPMTKVQMDKAILVVAELCIRYDIPVTEKTVLSHAEVQKTLGIKQRNKWDFTRLAYDPSLKGAKAIGDHIRGRVVAAITSGVTSMPTEPKPTGSPPLPAGATGVTIPSSLNFRDTPNGTIVGSLPKNTVLDVIGESGSWLNVKTPAGYSGWVHKMHVAIVDGPRAEEPTKPNPIRDKINELRQLADELEELIEQQL